MEPDTTETTLSDEHKADKLEEEKDENDDTKRPREPEEGDEQEEAPDEDAKKPKTEPPPDLAEKDDTEPTPILPSKEGTTIFQDFDVLSGRGGGTNVHPGNRNFRDLINLHRRAYLKARKNDKPAISRAIVRSVRDSNGRFLKKDEKSGLWFEIGDDAAREKTSQALRQRAPEMRKLLFDTEREEVRAAADEHLRQQRMLMGMSSENNGMVMGPNGGPPMFPMMAMPNGGMPPMPDGNWQQMYQAGLMGAAGMNRFPQQQQNGKWRSGSCVRGVDYTRSLELTLTLSFLLFKGLRPIPVALPVPRQQ
jgi:hypothetical protein